MLYRCYPCSVPGLFIRSIWQLQWRQRSIRSSVGRFRSKVQSKIIQKENEKSLFDDELYHDRDFDFESRSRRSIKQLFKEDREKFSKAKNKTFVNALYNEDDADDVKLTVAKNKLTSDKNSKFLNKFEKSISEQANEESELKDDNVRIKRKRTIIPLPYDINEENRFDILNQIVMPLYQMPYSEQLKKKLNQNKDVLRSLGSKLRQIDSPIRLGRSDLPCTLEPVRPSPQIERYRNKDEFSVWPGIDGNPKTVGFFVGQPSINDRVVCVEPYQIIITKQSHLDLGRKFQQYLRSVSPYDICKNYGSGGHWRRIHIRSNRHNQHMVTAIMHPQDLSQDQLQEEMDRLRDYFSDDPLISSLYFHASRHTRSTHTGEPYYHLAGDKTITEHIFDKKFAISPSSFFQVNTFAAEILYRVIMTELKVNKKTTVLDLCCGTGVLSILLSNQVKRVIGIDSSESSIEDAKKNSEANGTKNIEFIAGTVEKVLPKLASETYLKEPVVAVVNPSRRALHPHVVRTLKQMSFIKRLVYVSCKPEGDALRNFVQLCKSNSESPFVPINAVPVDLFPHTKHCELVITFERFC